MGAAQKSLKQCDEVLPLLLILLLLLLLLLLRSHCLGVSLQVLQLLQLRRAEAAACCRLAAGQRLLQLDQPLQRVSRW